MGGVDLLHGFIAYYIIPIRSKKYYLRFFSILLICALYLVGFCIERTAKCRTYLQKIRPIYYNLEVRQLLPYVTKGNNEVSRNSANYIDQEHANKKHKGPVKPIADFTVRRDDCGNWPSLQGDRQRCKMPGCKGLTSLMCSKCKTYLCLTKNKNCFVSFHLYISFMKLQMCN